MTQNSLRSDDCPTLNPRLGFGGSNLLGDKSRLQGLALLESAYDEGIRHFDVAPAYGYGDAEALVGEFARNKRDKIVITTKFGLEPIKPIAGAKGLLTMVRRGMRASPRLRSLVRRNAASLIRQGRFDVKSAQKSLERSLRWLQTDVIDIYLLHEAAPQDCSTELLDFLHGAMSRGKIRRFGIGAEFAHVQQVCSCRPEFASTIQIRSSLLEPNLALLSESDAGRQHGIREIISHGSLRIVPVLRQRLKSDPAWGERWNRRLGLDLHHENTVAGLILQQAQRSNREGMVLFQSASLTRVAANIRAAQAPRFAANQLDDFERLGAELQTAASG